MAETSRARRRWGLRAAALLGGTLVALLLAEGIARLFWQSDYPTPSSPMEWSLAEERVYFAPHIVEHPELGFVYAPGFRGTIAEPESRAWLRVDRYGMRGPGPRDHPGERWLLVGDSFTSALQVEEDQTFGHLLGERLGVETLNAGVDCYGTWQAARRYELLEQELNVDAVLLSFTLANDLIDNLRGLEFNLSPVPEALFDLDYDQVLRERLRARHPLLHRSHLFSQWFLRREMLRAESEDWVFTELMLYMFETWLAPPAELERLLEHTEPPLRRLRNRTRARGDRLLVALVPPMFLVDDRDYERWLDRLRRAGRTPAHTDREATPRAVKDLLAGLGIETCDLTPALAQAQAEGIETYLPVNRHWTEAGHRVVAEALARCVTEGQGGGRAPGAQVP